jgi:amino-acid N-acetyltransferase
METVVMDHHWQLKIRTIVVRKAKMHDVDNIVSFVNSLAHDGTLLRRTHDDVRASIGTFTIAETDIGRFLGCAALYCYGPNLAEVRSVAVHPEARGQGVGHLLMKAILKKADEHGIGCLCLFTRIADYFMSYDFHVVPHSALREKYYRDCHSCSRRYSCDETAMIRGELKHIAFIRQISSSQNLVQMHV